MLYIIYFIGTPAFCACKKSRTVAGQDINDRGGENMDRVMQRAGPMMRGS